MKRRLLLISVAGSALALAGCASQNISDYSREKPVLDLRQYFNGALNAYGVFTDRSGTVVKRFTVRMQCTWNADEGVLDEDFTYSDGTQQKRVWRLTRHSDGHYTGRADDVVGEAIGETAGNTFHWTYTLNLPIESMGGKSIEVQFDDWMYLMSDTVMLNKAVMRKFGVRLGEVTLTFVKR